MLSESLGSDQGADARRLSSFPSGESTAWQGETLCNQPGGRSKGLRSFHIDTMEPVVSHARGRIRATSGKPLCGPTEVIGSQDQRFVVSQPRFTWLGGSVVLDRFCSFVRTSRSNTQC